MEVAELPLVGVSYGSVLNGAGVFQATLPMPNLTQYRTLAETWVDATTPGQMMLLVLRNEEVVWSGVIWKRTPVNDGSALQIEGAGLWSIFRKRIIGATKNFTNLDQFLIAENILTSADQGENTALSPTMTAMLNDVVWTNLSGVLRTRSYLATDYKNVGEAIEQLAAVDGGFDFDIYAYRATSGAVQWPIDVRLFYPQKGKTAGQTTLEFSTGKNITSWSYSEDASTMSNYAYGVGAGEGAAMITARSSLAASFAANYPLMQEVLSLKDVSVYDTLKAAVDRQANLFGFPLAVPEVTVRGDIEPVLSDYSVGDYALVKIDEAPAVPSGFHSYARINTIDVSVSEDMSSESVQIKFGDVVERNIYQQRRAIEGRLRALER